MARQFFAQSAFPLDSFSQLGIGFERTFDPLGRHQIQFAVDISGNRSVIEGHAASPNSRTSASRPRTSREVSVPIGTSNIAAASL